MNAPTGRALHVDRGGRTRADSGGDRNGQGRIVLRHRAPIPVVEPAGDLGHHRVLPDILGVVLHLLLQIAGVEAREARNADAVSFALQPVAAEAGVSRPAFATAHGDDLAGLGEGRAGLVRRRRAGGRGEQEEGENEAHPVRTRACRYGSACGIRAQNLRRCGTLTMGRG
ncbi:hypothetical protein GCM10009422_28240 [Brevundimonas kwangchunensis]|uniref:Uncharacterized protein n=1 Tax=Brevundimonas kwangchunensis TaxID=322163 RepID=A0ABN1H5N0_9CAUL